MGFRRVIAEQNGTGLGQCCRNRLHLSLAVGEWRKQTPFWTGDGAGDEIASISSLSPGGYADVRK